MTWLCTICRRELGARWRENQGWAAAPTLAEDDPEIRAALESLLASEQGDPLLATHREEVRQSILAALDYLPAPYAEILECKYLRDMSIGEIARRHGPQPQGHRIPADAGARRVSRSICAAAGRRARSDDAMNHPDSERHRTADQARRRARHATPKGLERARAGGARILAGACSSSRRRRAGRGSSRCWGSPWRRVLPQFGVTAVDPASVARGARARGARRDADGRCAAA